MPPKSIPATKPRSRRLPASRTRQGQRRACSARPAPSWPASSRRSSPSARPVDLKPVSNEPLTLHMTEDAKIVYQAIGKAAGINVLFDPDYNSKRIQVDLNNVSLLDALRIVGTMSEHLLAPGHAEHHLCRPELARQAHRARRAGGADLLPDQCLAAERPERRADRAAQRAAEHQGLRRRQPERAS